MISFRALPSGASGLVSARTEPDLAAVGYEEIELVAAGAARCYVPTASSPGVSGFPPDGRITVEPAGTAPFATRVVLRRPVDLAGFSGTLVVEWLNVSSGNDAAPDWTFLGDEILRSGHAWAGVSAQYVGVEGGWEAVRVAERGHDGLKARSRYADLHHPGDAFAYDIFGSIADGLRADLDATTLLGVGESQSAVCLTTYVDAVHPVARVFDGFLLHSRGRVAPPLDAFGTGLVMDDVLGGAAVRIRTDLDEPVLLVQTEGDLFDRIGFLPARQPDTEQVRTWEVAGSAHADRYLMGEFESILGCTVPVNNGQQVFVLRAALRRLEEWVRGGAPAPTASPLALTPGGDAFATDPWGNVLGGVRTPAVDAAVERLSGRPWPDADNACRLFGSTTLLDTHPFGTREEYLAAYRSAVEGGIAAGFLLAEDRAALVADARWP